MTDVDPQALRTHGAYNGWCRVNGIPLKAADCPDCREADLAAALLEAREEIARLTTELDDARTINQQGRNALAAAIGMLEAHWEVCANPFPDPTLRRALDRMGRPHD